MSPNNLVGSRPTILIVEDESIIRMGAVALVVEAGFEAIEASNADEAIRILETRSDIHLVFTDIHMAGTMDGLKLAQYVRRRWPPVKLIVVSGGIDLQQLPEGAVFFPKPYREDAIVRAMAAMIEAA